MISRLSFLIVAAALAAAPARAQAPADFYRGKQITMMVGSDAGSGYDLYARLLARFLPRHIPGNPNLVVQNLPNAGSVMMANNVANTAPKDGTVIGAPQSSVAVERLLWLLSPGGKTAAFDADKLEWLGTMAQDVFVVLGSTTAKARTIEDLRSMDFVAGVAGPNTDGSLVIASMNKLLGTRMRIVLGYAGTTAELLAMERAEIDGAPMAYSTVTTLRPNWRTEGKIRVLLQVGVHAHADLPDTPFFGDLVKTQEERDMLSLIFAKYQMGRPLFAPPGTPADRVALLRDAFDATLKDPDLIAEAAVEKLELSPLGGRAVQDLVARLYASPPALVTRARQLLGTEK
jgi:tripartite-type tricarboxylate transporter receptor subunit TctC